MRLAPACASISVDTPLCPCVPLPALAPCAPLQPPSLDPLCPPCPLGCLSLRIENLFLLSRRGRSFSDCYCLATIAAFQDHLLRTVELLHAALLFANPDFEVLVHSPQAISGSLCFARALGHASRRFLQLQSLPDTVGVRKASNESASLSQAVPLKPDTNRRSFVAPATPRMASHATSSFTTSLVCLRGPRGPSAMPCAAPLCPRVCLCGPLCADVCPGVRWAPVPPVRPSVPLCSCVRCPCAPISACAYPLPPRVQRVLCPTNISVRTLIFWNPIDQVSGLRAE